MAKVFAVLVDHDVPGKDRDTKESMRTDRHEFNSLANARACFKGYVGQVRCVTLVEDSGSCVDCVDAWTP